MCPSDIYQLPVTESGFGPGAEVFASDTQNPCSIAIRDQALAQKVRIQIQRDNTRDWKDYEEGQLLIGKKIKCRLACRGATRRIAIEVFRT